MFRSRLLCVLFLSASGLSSAAFGQTSLTEAMARAYGDNPTLQADREGLKVLDEDVSAARSAGRPTLVAEGNVTRSDIDVRGTGGIIGARLSQPIFRGGRIRNNVRAAESNVLAGRESLRQSEIDIFAGVAEAYGNVLRDRQIIALNAELVRVLDAISDAEERRLGAGERTRTDVYQAQARLLTATASGNTATRRAEESAASYRRLVGSDPDQLQPLPPLPPLPATFDQALGIALENSPRIRQAEHARSVARYQRKTAEGALLPSADASASVNHRDEIVQILDRRVNQDLATFQFTVTVPIYQGGAEYAAVRRAKHVEALRDREIDEIAREVSTDVKIAWDRLTAARQSLATLERAVGQYEAAALAVAREADGGSRTTTDVLDAQRELTDAQIQLATARNEEHVAAYRLLAAMGSATASELQVPIDPYDPTIHAKQVAHKWAGFEP